MAADAADGTLSNLPFALGRAPGPWSDLRYFGIHAEAHMLELTLNLGADTEEVERRQRALCQILTCTSRGSGLIGTASGPDT